MEMTESGDGFHIVRLKNTWQSDRSVLGCPGTEVSNEWLGNGL